jgi:hypothetical protein
VLEDEVQVAPHIAEALVALKKKNRSRKSPKI